MARSEPAKPEPVMAMSYCLLNGPSRSMLQVTGSRKSLVQVHGPETVDSRLVAVRAVCGWIDVPEVGEDAATFECKTVGRCGFECGQFWRREFADVL